MLVHRNQHQQLLVLTSSTKNVAVVAVKPTFIPGCDLEVFDPVIVRRGLRAKHSEQQCRETAVSSTSEKQREPASSHRCCFATALRISLRISCS